MRKVEKFTAGFPQHISYMVRNPPSVLFRDNGAAGGLKRPYSLYFKHRVNCGRFAIMCDCVFGKPISLPSVSFVCQDTFIA